MRDRPFVLLGVNNDADRDGIKRVIQENQLRWRSWWDPDNRIAQQWGIQAWPSLFLIDDKGIIRQARLRPAELDAAAEQLVHEAEQNKKKS